VTKVLIADELSPKALDIFRSRGVEVDVRVGLKKPDLLSIIGGYDGLAVRSATKADKDVIAAAKNLKVIGRAGIGVDNIDIPSATARGIVVMNTPFGNSITTAEHAIALLFAAARHIAAADVSTQAGKWEKTRFMGIELYAKTLGLIGCGNIGALVAERALALKMKVIAYDPFVPIADARALDVRITSLDEVFSLSDVVSCHTPLLAETKHLLRQRHFERMKTGASFINTARGSIVCEAEMIHVLARRPDLFAVLDVTDPEPAATNSPLFGLPNVVVTPHIAGSLGAECQRLGRMMLEELHRLEETVRQGLPGGEQRVQLDARSAQSNQDAHQYDEVVRKPFDGAHLTAWRQPAAREEAVQRRTHPARNSVTEQDDARRRDERDHAHDRGSDLEQLR